MGWLTEQGRYDNIIPGVGSVQGTPVFIQAWRLQPV